MLCVSRTRCAAKPAMNEQFRKAVEGADFVMNSLQRALFEPGKMGSNFVPIWNKHDKSK